MKADWGKKKIERRIGDDTDTGGGVESGSLFKATVVKTHRIIYC